MDRITVVILVVVFLVCFITILRDLDVFAPYNPNEMYMPDAAYVWKRNHEDTTGAFFTTKNDRDSDPENFTDEELKKLSEREKSIIHGLTPGARAVLLYQDAETPFPRLQGWWQDVINCQQTGSIDLYCKPKDKWIWPY